MHLPAILCRTVCFPSVGILFLYLTVGYPQVGDFGPCCLLHRITDVQRTHCRELPFKESLIFTQLSNWTYLEPRQRCLRHRIAGVLRTHQNISKFNEYLLVIGEKCKKNWVHSIHKFRPFSMAQTLQRKSPYTVLLLSVVKIGILGMRVCFLLSK